MMPTFYCNVCNAQFELAMVETPPGLLDRDARPRYRNPPLPAHTTVDLEQRTIACPGRDAIPLERRGKPADRAAQEREQKARREQKQKRPTRRP